MTADDVAGRIAEDPADWDGPPRVIVDGRAIPWDELGRILKPYVGWPFALHLGAPEEETRGVTSQSAADGLHVVPGDAGAVTPSTRAADMPGDADEDEEIDDDALLRAWEEMDRQAVSVLHHALLLSVLGEFITKNIVLIAAGLTVLGAVPTARRNEGAGRLLQRIHKHTLVLPVTEDVLVMAGSSETTHAHEPSGKDQS